MKWILGYAMGAALLLTPIGLRVALRSEAASAALDQAAVSEGPSRALLLGRFIGLPAQLRADWSSRSEPSGTRSPGFRRPPSPA